MQPITPTLSVVTAGAEAHRVFGPKATVLAFGVNENTGHSYIAIHTHRQYGTFAILEVRWDDHNIDKVNSFHTGHYFDSMAEAADDLTARAGVPAIRPVTEESDWTGIADYNKMVQEGLD